MTSGLSRNAQTLMLAATALGAGLPLGRDRVDDEPREQTDSDRRDIEAAKQRRTRRHLKARVDEMKRFAGINRAKNRAAARVTSHDSPGGTKR